MDAHLAGVGVGPGDRSDCGSLDVGIGAHDERVFAAEFEGGADESLAGTGGNLASGRGRPGEADEVDIVDQGIADHRPGAGHDDPGVSRQTSRDEELLGPQQGQSRG